MSPRYLTLLSAFYVLVSLTLSAQAQYKPSDIHIYPNAPYTLAHGDLNNDGREDIVADCSTNSGVAFGVSLSAGDGIYGAQTCYQLPSGGLYQVAVGDFNGDGWPDLIALNGTNSFYEYLNNGDGTFSLPKTFVTSASEVYWMVAADVNHDGKIDLVFDDGFGGSSLYVYFGNGAGGFSAGPISRLPVQGELSLGDFDGDGNADILSQFNTYGNIIQVAYGDGQGNFQAANSFDDDAVYYPYDVNGDGKMDLLGEPFDFSINGSTYYKDVRVQYGNANRTFTEANIPLQTCNAGAYPPASADVNGDGIPDIVVNESTSCEREAPFTLNVMYGEGNGNFKPEQRVYSTQYFGPLSVLRVNQDTKPDFDYWGEVPGNLKSTEVLFENPLAGNFAKCQAPNSATGINVCSPTGGTSRSPVTCSIGASNQTPGRKVEVWIDGVKVGEQLTGWSYYSFMDAQFNVASGQHSVTIFSAGWDNLLESVTFPLTIN
jgi:hypothetical protein